MAEGILHNSDGNLRRVFQSGPILLDIPSQMGDRDLDAEKVFGDSPNCSPCLMFDTVLSGSLDLHAFPGWDCGSHQVRTNPSEPVVHIAPDSNALAIVKPPPQAAASADSYGATTSHAAGMSLPSGAGKSHISSCHDDLHSDSDAEQQPCSSAPVKRRRRRRAATNDYVYPDYSDPEEQRAEKRRAKNRRTAKLSRERKQAEFLKLKEDLEASKAEVAKLHQLIINKDTQIKQLMTAPVVGVQMGSEGSESTKRRVSESAVLRTCIYIATCMQTTRIPPPKTTFPSLPQRKCTTASGGEDIAQLRRELKDLLDRMPELQQHQLLWDILQEVMSNGLRGRVGYARVDAEGSDESDL